MALSSLIWSTCLDRKCSGFCVFLFEIITVGAGGAAIVIGIGEAIIAPATGFLLKILESTYLDSKCSVSCLS
jgi:hypothetical protein